MFTSAKSSYFTHLIVGLSLALSVAACGDDDDYEAELFELSGSFAGPESAHWDPIGQVWYVANFGQNLDLSGATPDEPAYVSRLNADGTVLDAKFVEISGDLLGLAVLDGTLYVAHGVDMLAVDIATRAVSTVTFPEGVAFLNDVATGNGAVWISDSVANVIYRYVPGGSPEVFSQDPLLAAPNGIYVDGANLIVGTLGSFPPDPNLPGALFSVSQNGAATRIGDLYGALDGVEKLGQDYLVSDFNGQLYLVDSVDGSFDLLLDAVAEPYGLQSTADIGLDPETQTVLIPDLAGNKAYFFDLTLR